MELSIFEDLPDDIKKDYMINFMSVKDINTLCSINNDYISICQDEELWLKLIYRDFGLPRNNRIIDNLKEIIEINNKRYYYSVYKLLAKIKILKRYSIDILIDIFLKTNKSTVYNIYERLLVDKSFENLEEIKLILKEIYTDTISDSIPQYVQRKNDIVDLLRSLIKRLKQRQLALLVFSFNQKGEKILNKLDAGLFNGSISNYHKNIDIYAVLDPDLTELFNSNTDLSFFTLIKLIQDNYTLENLVFFLNKYLSQITKTFIMDKYNNLIQLVIDTTSSFFANILSTIPPTDLIFINRVNHIAKFVIGKYIDLIDLNRLPSQEESVEILLEILDHINNNIEIKTTSSTNQRNIDKMKLDALKNITIPQKYKIDGLMHFLTL